MAQSRNVVMPSDYGPVIVNRHDTVIGHWIAQDGAWEKNEIELLRWLLSACYGKEPDIEILDIGANVGPHTIAFARFDFPGLTVHAFEAQRIVYQMLAGTVALNGLDNVYCHQKAVSSESGRTIEIAALDYDEPGDFGSLELETVENSDFVAQRLPNRTERIETVRIDDLGLSHVRLMKIDTEGMEHKVLAGAVRTIEACRPLIFLEHHKTDFAWIKAFLKHLDYRSHYTSRRNVVSLPSEFSNLQVEGISPVEE